MNITPAKIIVSVALAAASLLGACTSPRVESASPKAPAPICREVQASSEELRLADYNGEGNEWIRENGDGAVFGWSIQEDSIIWNSRACMNAHS